MANAYLSTEFFPTEERLEYGLKMVGAKGSVTLISKGHVTGVDIKCHVLASLMFPPKKLVDSEITTRLERSTDKPTNLTLSSYIDNDYKSEARRTIEVKEHGIETRYKKFEEERGYIEIPEGVQLHEIIDPLSVTFLARDQQLLSKNNPLNLQLLLRNGVVGLTVSVIDQRNTEITKKSVKRDQVRLQVSATKGETLLKGPYTSPDLEIWADKESGRVVEVTYPFLGSLGKASLFLENWPD